MDFKDDTIHNNEGLYYGTFNDKGEQDGYLFEEKLKEDVKKDIEEAKQINLKKLCKWFDKHDNDFVGIKINILIKAVYSLPVLQHDIFNSYFIGQYQYTSIKDVAKELGISSYKVNKELNKICEHLTQYEGILKKEK